MKNYIVEFIGTFFLVLTIGLAVAFAGAMAPIAIGSILMVMIYAGGHISGAHYNPAVTLAVWMRGACDTKDVPFYMLSQIAGGVLAAMVVLFLTGAQGHDYGAAKALNIGPSLIAEILGTFALCYVVLQTATTKSTSGNSYYGLAIGFTVMACAYGLGAISGGAFNPAVAAGVTAMGLKMPTDIWVFLVGNFAGAALAAVAFKAVYDGE